MATATETAFPANPSYFAGSQIIQSPFQFVADDDTFLRVISACSVSGVTLALQGRRLDENGELQIIQETHTPFSTRVTKAQDYKLGPGAVLNIAVFAIAGSPLIGQCYVQVQIMRNFGAVAIVLGTLVGGLVTATTAIAFPGSPVQSPLEVEPVVRLITGTQPAAGAGISEVVPTSARWELLTWSATIAALAGTVPSVNYALRVRSGANDVIADVPALTTSAGGASTVTVQFLAGYAPPAVTTNPIASAFATGFKLLAGSKLLTDGETNNQWTAPIYTVREWLDI